MNLTIHPLDFHAHIEPIISAILLILAGYFIGRILSASIAKAFLKQLTPQQYMLLRRFIFYIIILLFLASAFEQLGFQISAFLGAAGILTVAVGIAAQTSMSNVVSGLFMIGEKPFEVGNYIKVGDTQGEVLTIDLLSVKIRTLDNTMVRIPNDYLIKSLVINLSYFPIRRVDLEIGVSYQADLNQVKKVLFELADNNPLSLIEPKPLFQVLKFADSSINIQFSVWCSRVNYVDLKNSILIEIKKAFDKQGIELPFPARSLFTGSGSEPMPIKIVP
jgi:small-conductance mechanosensitive channel